MLTPLLAALLLAPPARSASFALDPPPAWLDVTSSQNNPAVLVALKGPETGSFILTRIAPISLDNKGVCRAFLGDVLDDINQKTGSEFTLASIPRTANYDNGLTAYYVLANENGKPRMALALTEFGGETMLATLISSVPEIMLPSIIGALRSSAGAETGLTSARSALSLDGQLFFALPRGLVPRPLAESERNQGFVLAVRGLDSELVIQKVVDDNTPAAEQAQVVLGTIRAVPGVESRSLSRVRLFATPAGADLIYATARVQDPSGPAKFVAGYMPWCYWGYSVLAKGPQAQELVLESFKTLALGPSAIPKLVAKTPRMPLPARSQLGWILAVLALFTVFFAVRELVMVRRRVNP